MGKKSGFTLIELLATIVILAIILLIAVPKISEIIQSTREKAFKISVSSIVKSAEFEVFESHANGNVLTTLDLVDLEYSGEQFTVGSIKINNNQKIEVYIWNEKLEKCAYKSFDSNEVVFLDNKVGTDCSSGGALAELDIPTTDPRYACFTFDEVTQTLTDYEPIAPCTKDLVIPTSINGIQILHIGDNFQTDITFDSIDLSNAIYLTTIGNYAFSINIWYFSSSVESIDFSSLTNLESIGAFAFEGVGLTSVDFSNNNSLVAIGNGSFRYNKIENITLPNTNLIMESNSFINNAELTDITITNSSIIIPSQFIDYSDTFKDAFLLYGPGHYTGTVNGAWTKQP